MSTKSFPAKGKGGFSISQWATFFDAPDGIVNDYTSAGAFPLTRINAGNIARIGASTAGARVDGYTLVVDANHDLTVPTAAGIYRIAVKYDPDLNVAQGDLTASPDGPCRLIIAAELDTTGNDSYLLLYEIIRAAGQNLTDAAIIDYRRFCGSTIVAPSLNGGPAAGLGPYPRGTIALVGGFTGMERLVRGIRTVSSFATGVTGEIGELEWFSLTSESLIFPAPGSLVSADGTSAYARREEGRVFLEGTLKRSSNASLSNGANVTLGTMPRGWRPAGGERRFICYGNGVGSKQVIAPVTVKSDTGAVIMYDPPAEVVWIDLSGINYRAGI